jgi:hypothetical protein
VTVIKVLLILAVVGLLVFLLRSHGTNRGGAYLKIGMGVFMAFAVYAVIRPEDVSWVAARLGVGRGTDLILYLLVVGFGFFAISTYLRFKELELKYARLARAIALNEADRRDQMSAGPGRSEGSAGSVTSGDDISPPAAAPSSARAHDSAPNRPTGRGQLPQLDSPPNR